MLPVGQGSGRQTFFHEDTGLLVMKQKFKGTGQATGAALRGHQGRRPLPACLALSLSPPPPPPSAPHAAPVAPPPPQQSRCLCTGSSVTPAWRLWLFQKQPHSVSARSAAASPCPGDDQRSANIPAPVIGNPRPRKKACGWSVPACRRGDGDTSWRRSELESFCACHQIGFMKRFNGPGTD